MNIVKITGFVLGILSLPAIGAQHRDPSELIRLHTVLKRAMDRVAPSTVTVETFGGSRRVLTNQSKHSDGAGKARTLTKPVLEDLLRDLDRDDRKRSFPDASEDELDTLEPEDLNSLDGGAILRLVKKYPPRPQLIDKQHAEFFALLSPEDLEQLAPGITLESEQKAAVQKQLTETLKAKEVHAWLAKLPLYPTLNEREWQKLFDIIPEAELAELFPDLDKDKLDALGPDDLKKLPNKVLVELLKKHPLRQKRPIRKPSNKDEKKKPKKGIGRLVQPGFLQAQGATTGIVLSSDGWILLSRFALNFDPSTILVTLADGRSFHAERFGEDTSRGIAVVKIDATDLPVPTFAEPAEVRVGQWAFILGRTFGADRPSVHMGVVSATNRLFKRAIQTDANTSPANYGGPLIDVHGRVLGISVPLSPTGRDVGVDWYDSGIGFASTIADIADLIERMKMGENLHRGWIGIKTAPEFMGPGGRIQAVVENSPAQRIGLKRGDKILAIDKVKVKNAFHLQTLIGSKMAGDPIHLLYQRRRQDPVGITVFLAEVPQKERKAQSKKEETHTQPWEDGDPAEKKQDR